MSPSLFFSGSSLGEEACPNPFLTHSSSYPSENMFLIEMQSQICLSKKKMVLFISQERNSLNSSYFRYTAKKKITKFRYLESLNKKNAIFIKQKNIEFYSTKWIIIF